MLQNYMYALHTPLFPDAVVHRHLLLLPRQMPRVFFFLLLSPSLFLDSAAREVSSGLFPVSADTCTLLCSMYGRAAT